MTDSFDILDATLDDLADLPTSAPFPIGAHRATMFIELSKVKAPKKPMVIAKFKHKETLEQADATAVPADEGQEAMYFVHIYKKDGSANEIGQGQLKVLLAPLREAGLEGSPRELIEATKVGVDVDIVVGQRDYNGSPQMELKKISLSA